MIYIRLKKKKTIFDYNILDYKIRSSQENINTKYSDVGLWNTLTKDDISFWVQKGPADCQNWQDSFEKSKQIYKNQARYCSRGLFYSTKINGEKYSREWLVYSPSTGCVYCFVCKLFSNSNCTLANNGFNDWRNSIVIKQHENLNCHRAALLTYLTRKGESTLNTKLEKQIIKEQKYWRQVLQRIVAVVSTLAERGLPFRGTEEKFDSPQNGNFLGLLELIAQFDPFLADHISRYGNSGKPSYLSKTICNEIIDLMAEKVRNSIFEDLRKAGYFSLSVDSTPDYSHIDQLTVIVRYVSPHDGYPVERFLTFISIENNSGENLANLIFNYIINECKIDFNKCRRQSYDNAANMSGRYKGMQQKILEKYKYAVYIPCAGHSLNLVGRAAVNCCIDAVNFFAILQQIYIFFSASTKRWSILKSSLGSNSEIPKCLSDTRWEANVEATRAVLKNYDLIIDALKTFQDNEYENGETKREASIIHEKIKELEFMFMLILYNNILEEFQKTSKILQDPQTSLNICSKMYAYLSEFIKKSRNDFDKFEQNAKEN